MLLIRSISARPTKAFVFRLVSNHNPTDLCASCVRDGTRVSLDRPELIKMSGYRIAPEQTRSLITSP